MILFCHIASGEFFDIDNLESPANDELPQGSYRWYKKVYFGEKNCARGGTV